MNIYEKLSAISIDLSNVAKNLEVGIGSSKYKAVGEADVLKAVKPLEAKYKVYSYPYSRQIIESGTTENTNSKGETKKNLFERIEVVYRFVNIEKPEEYVDITSYGDGIDSQDKSVGKAMTYADKYALLKAYKIITGEDPDQEESNELKRSYTKTAQKQINTIFKQDNNYNAVTTALIGSTLTLKDIEELCAKKGKSLNELNQEEVDSLLNVIENRKNAIKNARKKLEEDNNTNIDDIF